MDVVLLTDCNGRYGTWCQQRKGVVTMEEIFLYVWLVIFLSMLSAVFGDWVWYLFPFY